MGWGAPTPGGGIQRSPLAPRAQDRENGIRTLPIGDPRAPTPKALAVDGHRQQGLEHCPEFLCNPVAGRDFIPRRPGPSPFLPSGRCHRLEYTKPGLFG